jgi:hypothetical protein
VLTTEKDIFSKMIRDRIEKEAAQNGPEPGPEKDHIKKTLFRSSRNRKQDRKKRSIE